MITAIIRNKENTLVLELPHSVYDIYEKLQSIGIMQPPKQIPLTDNEDEPRAVVTPDKKTIRQQGRWIKGPNEPMFTLTVQDRHGILRYGRVRKLTPRECWRLQGFTDEQFDKAKAAGLSDGRLYKMAGNAVSVPVVSAAGAVIKRIYQEQIQKG